MPLPPLRADLALSPAAPERDGAPAWLIEDPVTNRFFRIGWIEQALWSRWSLGEPQRLLDAVNRETPLAVTAAELNDFIAFLRGNQLLRAVDAADTARLLAQHRAAHGSRLKWLLHHYLFFRIPLVRPQAWLTAALPWVEFCFRPAARWLTLAATLLGLLLAARQWDHFVHTFQDQLSPAGLLGFVLALVVAKALHELGHAFTATRLGVPVAHMGIAFLVMWPMLYTDTGASWRLSDRRQRFAIAAAGIRTELALAGFATLGWSLADDGPLRSALFFLATTSWLLTLAINASPFMRFDGYFLLSDALDLPNLHARSFALARAALRRGLLGWDEPDPEPFAPRLRRGLIGFAWLTWLYRLVVYLGIAVAVYLFFFKLLGLVLLAVELAWFVLRPIGAELAVWYRGRRRAQAGHVGRTLAILIALAALLAVPWQRDVRAEAWLHSAQQQAIYSPLAARVVEIARPGPQAEGAVLVRLDSPDTRSRIEQSLASAGALALQLDQTVGRAEGLERRARIAEQLAEQRAEAAAQRAELQRLTLVAAFDGILDDVDPEVAPGVWVNPGQPIAMLFDPRRWVVDALVPQDAIARIAVGAAAAFHARGRFAAPIAGEVVAIDTARVQSLPHPMLATAHGGRVPAVAQPGGQLAPRDALYRVRIRLDAVPEPRQTLGSVTIAGARRSLIADWATRAAALLIRESGF
ncbi:MAG: HlyD family efflux transporter periplasmic adaptor subunit [Lautropia sp.]